MLSFPDIAILSGVALLVFGPDRLPGVARQVGQAVGMLRSTSNAFLREFEHAGTIPTPEPKSVTPQNLAPAPAPSQTPAHSETAVETAAKDELPPAV